MNIYNTNIILMLTCGDSAGSPRVANSSAMEKLLGYELHNMKRTQSFSEFQPTLGTNRSVLITHFR